MSKKKNAETSFRHFNTESDNYQTQRHKKRTLHLHATKQNLPLQEEFLNKHEHQPPSESL